jgi:hypothetical protein
LQHALMRINYRHHGGAGAGTGAGEHHDDDPEPPLAGGTAEGAFAQLQALLLLARTAKTDDDDDDNDDDDEDINKKKAAVWCEPDPVTGWTFLHYCASTDLPSRHWEWLLAHCPTAAVVSTASSSPLVAHQTALGETVVDVFFQHRLGQLKWQSAHSKVHARRLVAVLARADQTVIAALPTTGAEIVQGQVVTAPNEPAMMIQPPAEEQEHQQQQLSPVSALSLSMLRHHVEAEHDDIRTARTFLRDLYLLLQKILLPRPEEPLLDWMMTALAIIGPSVPVIVAEWMELYLDHVHVVAASSSSSSRRLFTTTTTTTDQQAQTWTNSSSHCKQKALHILCQTKPLAHLPRQSPPLLSMFLTQEGANSVIVETGRLPIEQALQSGWCFEGLSELWKLTTTTTPPPVSLSSSSSSSLSTTGWLPLCAYTAMTTTDDDDDQKERAMQILARHQRGTAFSVYCWHMSSEVNRQGFLAVARHDYDRAQLTSIYECLRAAPSSVRRCSGNTS